MRALRQNWTAFKQQPTPAKNAHRMTNLFLLAAIWAVPTIAITAPILKKQQPGRDGPASKAMFLKRVRSPISGQLSLVQQECLLAATAFTFA
jgi:hypothetical protein